jgi:hypothetical protein
MLPGIETLIELNVVRSETGLQPPRAVLRPRSRRSRSARPPSAGAADERGPERIAHLHVAADLLQGDAAVRALHVRRAAHALGAHRSEARFRREATAMSVT